MSTPATGAKVGDQRARPVAQHGVAVGIERDHPCARLCARLCARGGIDAKERRPGRIDLRDTLADASAGTGGKGGGLLLGQAQSSGAGHHRQPVAIFGRHRGEPQDDQPGHGKHRHERDHEKPGVEMPAPGGKKASGPCGAAAGAATARAFAKSPACGHNRAGFARYGGRDHIFGGPAMSKAFLGGFIVIAILAVTGVDYLDQARRAGGLGPAGYAATIADRAAGREVARAPAAAPVAAAPVAAPAAPASGGILARITGLFGGGKSGAAKAAPAAVSRIGANGDCALAGSVKRCSIGGN